MPSDVDTRPACSPEEVLQTQADRALAHRSAVSMLAMFAIIPTIAFGTSIPSIHPILFKSLVISILGLGALRIALVRLSHSAQPADRAWIAALKFSIAGGALVWGGFLARVIHLQGLHDWNSMVLLMVLMGVGAGSAVTLMSHYWVLAFAVSAAIAPIVVVSILLGGARGYAVGCGLVLFSGYLLMQGRVLNQHYWRGLKDNRKLQESLRELEIARAAAESASHAKSQFLDNMSHELRTPLNGMLGMMELMEQTGLDPEQREYCQMAKSAGETLSSLVTDVLDFSTLEAGDFRLAHADFRLSRLAQRTQSSFARLLKSRPECRLTFDISPELPDHLCGDEDRLRQVLCCLIGNAVKFSGHGEIQVRIRPGQVRPNGIELNVEVQDYGVGIDAAIQEEIFEPFVQADRSLSRRMGGLGLGLAICQRIVHKMGGAISVVSSPGNGSCFRFSAVLEVQNCQVLTQQDRIPA